MPEPVLTLGLLAGYSALYAAAQGGPAVSPEAEEVRSRALEVVETAERSHALFGGKAEAISQIWELAADCALPGWNGEDAEPIDQFAAMNAADFIRALPDTVPLPEFAPEPDGSISLDWIQSRRRLFSLSVGRTNRLAVAWLDGADKGHAVARFDGTKIPSRVLQGIESIVNDGNAPLRTA
jgi:hypothetical protein